MFEIRHVVKPKNYKRIVNDGMDNNNFIERTLESISFFIKKKCEGDKEKIRHSLLSQAVSRGKRAQREPGRPAFTHTACTNRNTLKHMQAHNQKTTFLNNTIQVESCFSGAVLITGSS